MNLREKKILVCICHHYSEERLEYLNKVIKNCLSYPMDVKIIVDTNRIVHSVNNSVELRVHNDLSHPYNLTWKHRLSMLDNIDNYDYFMYLEDDMLVPFDNFFEYIKNFDLLYPINCVPSFIRIEENNGKEYVTDVIEEQNNVLVSKQGD